MGKYSFRLRHDKVKKQIYICVYTVDGKTLLDDTVYYTYDDIEAALTHKLNSLFYVKAVCGHTANGDETFLFNSAEIYTGPSLEKFLKMLDAGEIMYDIRMGAYQSGKKKGKPHDHGSGFRIRQSDICKLYQNHTDVN